MSNLNQKEFLHPNLTHLVRCDRKLKKFQSAERIISRKTRITYYNQKIKLLHIYIYIYIYIYSYIYSPCMYIYTHVYMIYDIYDTYISNNHIFH